MEVEAVEATHREGTSTLTATVRFESGGRRPFPLRYGFRHPSPGLLAPPGNALLAALLPIAMAVGEPLRLDQPVSERLLGSTGQLMDLFEQWGPRWRARLRPVEISAPAAPASPAGAGTALFFSCGVDSFYTLQRQRPSHLLFVKGFDVDASNAGLARRVESAVSETAAASGLEVLLVESNVRSLSEQHLNWELYHGAAMASVGLAAGGLLNRFIIASSWAGRNVRPWGSHALLDPLWSTEATEFVHDRTEAVRWQRVEAISREPLALERLRVCWQPGEGEYNCGRCSKCLLTMSMLDMAGALERCPTLPDRIDTGALRRIDFSEEAAGTLARDLLSGMNERGYRGRVRTALQLALLSSNMKRAVKRPRRFLAGRRRTGDQGGVQSARGT
jgi:hypothetical protein